VTPAGRGGARHSGDRRRGSPPPRGGGEDAPRRGVGVLRLVDTHHERLLLGDGGTELGDARRDVVRPVRAR
jgi:hypothetical protein